MLKQWKSSLRAAGCAGALGGALLGSAARGDEPVRAIVVKPRPKVLYLVADEQPADRAGDEASEPKDVVIELKEQPEGPVIARRRFLADRAELQQAPGKYWIGVMCTPVEESLRAHLDLGEGEGIMVADVLEEGPAAKSGLKKFDVIVQAGDKKLTEVGALIDAVEATGENDMALEVVRGGKHETITVRPVERKQEIRETQPERRDAFRWFQGFRDDGEGPVMRFFQPGMVFPPAPRMPDDLEIRIQKHGNEPAKIHVEQGDKTWDVTEDKLDDLPEETRGHVSRLLGKGMPHFDFVVPQEGEFRVAPPVGPQGTPLPPGAQGPQAARTRVRQRVEEGVNDRLEKRLDQLNERIDRLQSLIERLQQDGAAAKDAPPAPQ